MFISANSLVLVVLLSLLHPLSYSILIEMSVSLLYLFFVAHLTTKYNTLYIFSFITHSHVSKITLIEIKLLIVSLWLCFESVAIALVR